MTNYYFNQFGEQIDGTIYHWLWLGNRRVAHGSLHSGVNYLYADQLGSTVKTSGAQAATQRYEPYGAKRGTDTVATTYRYTGQREESALGLYDYGARWYDPTIARFIQADSIVPQPGNPQSLNRYSYVLNNPMKYTDPTGQIAEDEQDKAQRILDEVYALYEVYITPDWYYWEGRFIEGLWSLGELTDINIALGDISSKYSSIDTFKNAAGKVYVTKTSRNYSEAYGATGDIFLGGGFSWYSQLERKALFTHELFHIVDWRSGSRESLRYSTKMQLYSGVGNTIGANSLDPENPGDDFADAAAGFVYPEWADSFANRISSLSVQVAGTARYQRNSYIGSPRWNYAQSIYN